MLSTFFFALFIVHCAILAEPALVESSTTDPSASSAVYFAYGSNLLKERIERSVKVTRAGVGKIKDHRLDFGYFSKRWNGAVATIVPDPGYEVWGAIYHLADGFDKLDEQEGVADNVYNRFSVEIEIPDGKCLYGYTYMLTKNPEKSVALDELSKNRQPSKAYMDVIIRGAEETGLPISYTEKLKNVLHNNYNGPVHYDIV